MAVDFNDLIQNVYDYLLNLYGSPGSTFLAFEKIGQPVSPADFKLKAQDVGFSTALALERFSELVNHIPAISADSFVDTLRKTDDFYSMLLTGSLPQTNDGEALNLFAALKKQAQQRLDQAELGSSVPGGLPFHPAYASPSDWFDPSNVGNWTQHSFSIDPSGSPVPGPRPPIRPSQAVALWRLSPDSANVRKLLQADPQVMARFNPNLLHALATNLDSDPGSADAVSKAEPAATTPASVAHVAEPPRAVGSATRPTAVARTSVLEAMDATSAAPATVPLTLDHSFSSVGSRVVLDSNISLIDRLALQRVLSTTAPTKNTSSNNFALSFAYCLVTADRPWLYQPFLYDKSWYVPGYKVGDFSAGTAENNQGLLPAIVVAFIVIKDLQITANWSSDDIKAAQNSIGIGPFSLLGATFTSNFLVCKGIQIIGWISQIMPVLPPNEEEANH